MEQSQQAQSEELERALGDLPAQVGLDDGREMTIRLMTAEDRQLILDFAASLPEHDLLFLRVDITQPDVVDGWLARIGEGFATSLVATVEGRIAGYATVERNPARWTRRVGEIRVNVGPELRGHGLGRHLTSRIFSIAYGLGLKKLMAHMTPDQLGAQAAFKRLGFQPEAVLADYVEDRAGIPRDLLIFSYDVDGLNDQANRPLRL